MSKWDRSVQLILERVGDFKSKGADTPILHPHFPAQTQRYLQETGPQRHLLPKLLTLSHPGVLLGNCILQTCYLSPELRANFVKIAWAVCPTAGCTAAITGHVCTRPCIAVCPLATLLCFIWLYSPRYNHVLITTYTPKPPSAPPIANKCTTATEHCPEAPLCTSVQFPTPCPAGAQLQAPAVPSEILQMTRGPVPILLTPPPIPKFPMDMPYDT